MKLKTNSALIAVLSMPILLISAGAASADSVTLPLQLSDSETASGTIVNSTTPTAFNTLPAVGTYSHGFSSQQKTLVAGTTSGFFDDYIFSVAQSTADSVTSTINLAGLTVTGLQERLLKFTPGETLPALNDTTDGWSSTSMFNNPPVSGEITVLPSEMLGAGTYVLEVRGTAAGLDGGTYTGQLNLNPVPLPAGLVLLLSGLGLLGGSRKFRRFALFGTRTVTG